MMYSTVLVHIFFALDILQCSGSGDVSIFARVGYIDKYTLLNGLLIIKSLR